MKLHVIAFQSEAVDQIVRIRDWWVEQRQSAPSLFDEELVATLDRLADAPATGPAYARPGATVPLRRVLMPRSRYHVYYTVDDGRAVVTILGVWHASRGHGPRM